MKRKAVVLAVILISVVLIVVFSIQKPTPKPDFQISNVYGKVQGPPDLPFYQGFYLIFDIENNGTSVAHNVTGTAKYWKNGQWITANWWLEKEPNVLEVNEKVRQCFAVFSHCSIVPSEEFVITMSCNEGTLTEFNVTIT